MPSLTPTHWNRLALQTRRRLATAGWSRRDDSQYLDLLDKLSVRATFFLVGQAMLAFLEQIQAYLHRGHEIAGHGFTHQTAISATFAATRPPRSRAEPTRRLYSIPDITTACGR